MPGRALVLPILFLTAPSFATRASEPPSAGKAPYSPAAWAVSERLGGAELTQRSWPIADVLRPIIEAGKAAPIADPIGRAQASLRKLIMEAVAPRSWSATGKGPTVEFDDERNELVVRQTADNLEEVEGFLDALRRLVPEMDTPELFECFYRELWEAHHDQASWMANSLSVLVPVRFIGHLPVMEPPHFWAAMANSPWSPISWRRECAFQLFRRHVRPGTKLSELAAMLNHPTWLRRNHVSDWKQVAGSFYIEVAITAEDSTFGLALFPEYGGGEAVLLRVSGEISKEEFVNVLREGNGNGGRDGSILELSVRRP